MADAEAGATAVAEMDGVDPMLGRAQHLPAPDSDELPQLLQMFPNVSSAIVRQYYNENNGDMNDTITALLTVEEEPIAAGPVAGGSHQAIGGAGGAAGPLAVDKDLEQQARRTHGMLSYLLAHDICERDRGIVHLCTALMQSVIDCQLFVGSLHDDYAEVVTILSDAEQYVHLQSLLHCTQSYRVIEAIKSLIHRGELAVLPNIVLPGQQPEATPPQNRTLKRHADPVASPDKNVPELADHQPKQARTDAAAASTAANDDDVQVNDQEDENNGEEVDDDEPGPSNHMVPDVLRSPSMKQAFQHVDKEKFAYLDVTQQKSCGQLIQMFPTADPTFVVDEVIGGKSMEALVEEMFTGKYPKLKTHLEKSRAAKRRDALIDPTRFDVNAFLETFEDPEAYFSDMTRTVTPLYVRHAQVYLHNKFPIYRTLFLDRLLKEYNNHLLPTVNKINAGPRTKGRARRKLEVPFQSLPQFCPKGQERIQPTPYPDEVDEAFFREMQYLNFGDLIRGEQTRRREHRESRMEQARADNVLLECQCCFDDECLPEDMLACEHGKHSYCTNCIKQHSNTVVSDGGHRVKCISDECEDAFSMQILGRVLRPNMIDMMLRRMQQDELRRAQLDNMESCPFCDFAIIIENDVDRVFKCQNPECLKESCRLCHEPSHIPLKCDEVEKDVEVKIRTFIEEEMAKALIRICPKCSTQIIKIDGCNKMTCTCGAKFCYVCRVQIHDYSHFQETQPGANNNTAARTHCPLHTSLDKVNADAALNAGHEAKRKFLQDNPHAAEILERIQEAKGTSADTDVEKLVDKAPNRAARPDVEVPSSDSDDSSDDDNHDHAQHLAMAAVAQRDNQILRAQMRAAQQRQRAEQRRIQQLAAQQRAQQLQQAEQQRQQAMQQQQQALQQLHQAEQQQHEALQQQRAALYHDDGTVAFHGIPFHNNLQPYDFGLNAVNPIPLPPFPRGGVQFVNPHNNNNARQQQPDQAEVHHGYVAGARNPAQPNRASPSPPQTVALNGPEPTAHLDDPEPRAHLDEPEPRAHLHESEPRLPWMPGPDADMEDNWQIAQMLIHDQAGTSQHHGEQQHAVCTDENSVSNDSQSSNQNKPACNAQTPERQRRKLEHLETTKENKDRKDPLILVELLNTQDHLLRALKRLQARLHMMKEDDPDRPRITGRIEGIENKLWMVNERLDECRNAVPLDPEPAAGSRTQHRSSTDCGFAARPFSYEDLVARKLLIQGRISDVQRELRQLPAAMDEGEEKEERERLLMGTLRSLIAQSTSYDRRVKEHNKQHAIERASPEDEPAKSDQPDSLIASLIVTLRDMRRASQRLHHEVLQAQRRVAQGKGGDGMMAYLFRARDDTIRQQNGIEEKLLMNGLSEEQIEIVSSETLADRDTGENNRVETSEADARLITTKMLNQLDAIVKQLAESLTSLDDAQLEQDAAHAQRIAQLDEQLRRIDGERDALRIRIRHEIIQRNKRDLAYKQQRALLQAQLDKRRHYLQTSKNALRQPIIASSSVTEPSMDMACSSSTDEQERARVLADVERLFGAHAKQTIITDTNNKLDQQRNPASPQIISDEEEPEILFEGSKVGGKRKRLSSRVEGVDSSSGSQDVTETVIDEAGTDGDVLPSICTDQ